MTTSTSLLLLTLIWETFSEPRSLGMHGGALLLVLGILNFSALECFSPFQAMLGLKNLVELCGLSCALGPFWLLISPTTQGIILYLAMFLKPCRGLQLGGSETKTTDMNVGQARCLAL